MNKRHQANVDRLNRVKTFYGAHQLSVDVAIPAFGLEMPRLDQAITYISNLRTLANTKIQPITVTKFTARKKLEDLACQIAIAVRFYAQKNLQDELLMNQATFNDSDFVSFQDGELVEEAKYIHGLALPLIPPSPGINPLAQYSVTPEKLTELSEAIATFEDIRTDARNLEIQIKGYNEELEGWLTKADKIIATLDKYARFFKSDTALYREYRNARRLDNPKSTYTQIAGKITTVDGATVGGVLVTGIGQPYPKKRNGEVITVPGKTYTAISNDEGEYELKTPDYRTSYTVIYTKAGMQEVQRLGVSVSKGEETTLDITMMPAQA